MQGSVSSLLGLSFRCDAQRCIRNDVFCPSHLPGPAANSIYRPPMHPGTLCRNQTILLLLFNAFNYSFLPIIYFVPAVCQVGRGTCPAIILAFVSKSCSCILLTATCTPKGSPFAVLPIGITITGFPVSEKGVVYPMFATE